MQTLQLHHPVLIFFFNNFLLLGIFFPYLEDELIRIAQFGRVLLKQLVLFDLLVVGCVQEQLFDVRRLQPVGGHIHQDLPELCGRQLEMGDEDGCREEEERRSTGSR